MKRSPTLTPEQKLWRKKLSIVCLDLRSRRFKCTVTTTSDHTSICNTVPKVILSKDSLVIVEISFFLPQAENWKLEIVSCNWHHSSVWISVGELRRTVFKEYCIQFSDSTLDFRVCDMHEWPWRNKSTAMQFGTETAGLFWASHTHIAQTREY